MSKDKENRKPESSDEVLEGEVVETSAEAESAVPSADNAVPQPEIVVSLEEFDQLAEKLQQSETQAKDYFDGWQRERADFANYKRRIERDQQMIQQNITMNVLKKYLAVQDDLERALKNRPVEGSDGAWSNGIELILRKLQNILDAEGVKRIPAETEEFNPSRHEAISYEESPDHSGGQIIEVVQQGYTLGDRVIRPAMVRVARG